MQTLQFKDLLPETLLLQDSCALPLCSLALVLPWGAEHVNSALFGTVASFCVRINHPLLKLPFYPSICLVHWTGLSFGLSNLALTTVPRTEDTVRICYTNEGTDGTANF